MSTTATTPALSLADRAYWTPPQLAKLLGRDVHTVLGWIARRELDAADLREPGSSRPRWSIAREDVERFLLRRRNGVSTPKPARARKQLPKVKEYIR